LDQGRSNCVGFYSDIVENYLEKYKTLKLREFPPHQEKAIGFFSRLGFPTSKNEEWKYTNIAPIVSTQYANELPALKVTSEEILKRFPFAEKGIRIVLENGKLNANASNFENGAKGIEILSLSNAKTLPLVQENYNRYADVQEDAFAALNTAFSNDGVVIIISAGVAIEIPVYIFQVGSSQEQAVISHNRLLLIAEKNSKAKISCIAVSKNENTESFSNSVMEIVVGENANLEFDLLQNENVKSFQICGTHIYQSANSVFSINTISLGGRILKNKLHIKLDGLNCETHMHGLYVAGGTQLIDNHTAVYHSKPYCNSNELYKGIIGGKAHGVFNGKIFVEKDAQKTNAYQSNKNILLSNDAVVNAKPQLEIFADDVKCTHGATTGQMDDEALFYLRSRGINEDDAKALLNLAFANDILNNISLPEFSAYISSLVELKLKDVAY
jgi:Fe-S cluster assembly protein SufD